MGHMDALTVQIYVHLYVEISLKVCFLRHPLKCFFSRLLLRRSHWSNQYLVKLKRSVLHIAFWHQTHQQLIWILLEKRQHHKTALLGHTFLGQYPCFHVCTRVPCSESGRRYTVTCNLGCFFPKYLEAVNNVFICVSLDEKKVI